MGRIHKDLTWVYQFKFIAFLQYMGKYLLKEVSILKTEGVVFFRTLRNEGPYPSFQDQGTIDNYVHFNFLYGLTHASDAIQVLDEGNHVIHTEHLDLSSFLVLILSHHRNIPPVFDTSIITEKSYKIPITGGFIAL